MDMESVVGGGIDELLEQADSASSGSRGKGHGLVLTPVADHTTTPSSPRDRVEQVPDDLIPFTKVVDEGTYSATEGAGAQSVVLQPQAEESYEEGIDRKGTAEAFSDLIDLTDRALEQGIIFKEEAPEQIGQSFQYFDGELLRADIASYDVFDSVQQVAETYGEDQVEKNVTRAYMNAARGTAQLSDEDESELVRTAATESEYINESEFSEGEAGTGYQNLLNSLEVPEV